MVGFWPKNMVLTKRSLTRGPLSPYLYIMCVEGLSALINQTEARGDLHGCRINSGAPRISHLLFVMIVSYFVTPLYKKVERCDLSFGIMNRSRDKQ